MAKELGKMAS